MPSEAILYDVLDPPYEGEVEGVEEQYQVLALVVLDLDFLELPINHGSALRKPKEFISITALFRAQIMASRGKNGLP